MQIRYSKKFIKEFKKCPTNIQNSFKKRLIVFLNCPNHSLLNNHSLVGQLKGYKSINITGDGELFLKNLTTSRLFIL